MTRIQNAGTEVVEAKAGAVCLTYLLSRILVISINMRCQILFSVLSCNQSIKTHLYSAICRERIRGTYDTVADSGSLSELLVL